MTTARKAVPDDGSADEASTEASESGALRPSRTELTRAAHAINKLGLKLTRLSASDLDRLELTERLREEVELSQRLKPKSRGRQNRLIGQLLRAEDHEAIAQRLDALEQDHRLGVQHERVTERWVERLVDEGDTAVAALLEEFPDGDRQRLRLLVRNARKHPNESSAKRARRELLRAVRALRA